MLKRVLAILLSVAMLLCACSALADPIETTAAEKNASDNKVQKLTEEPVTLTIWADITNTGAIGTLIENLDDMKLLKVMEEKTGVHVECICPPVGEAQNAFSLMLASGSYPDIIIGFNNYYTYSGDTAIEEGVIVDFNDYADVMPNYNALRTATTFRNNGTKTDLGNMPYVYILPYNDQPGSNCGGAIIRQDLLDKLGMEMPETFDELHTFLTRCVNELGLKRALALDYNGASKYDGLSAGFDMHLPNQCLNSPFYLVDGVITYAPLSEGYKEYITMMSQWYAEGLVDPDFASVLTFDDGIAMVTSGECAVSSDHGGILGLYNELGKAADPDYNFVSMPIPVRNKGDKVHYGASSGIPLTAAAVVTTSCKNPELACRYIDQYYSDEGFILTNYGEEGVTFNWVDGEPVYTDLITKNPQVDSVAAIGAYMTPVTWFMEAVINRDYTDETRASTAVWDAMNDCAMTIPAAVALNTEEKERYGDYYSEIESYVNEMTVRFIMGTEPLENYDAFVNQLHSLGIDEAIAAYQSAYDRYASR